MDHFRRWLVNIAAAASLLILGATVSLYFRTSRSDSFYVRTGDGSYFMMNGSPGLIDLNWSKGNPVTGLWEIGHRVYGTSKFRLPAASFWNHLGFWGGFTAAYTMPDGSEVHYQEVMVPPWSACALFSVLPLVRIWRYVGSRYSSARGHCRRCGYDLRATPDRCPECGTIPPIKEIASN